MLNLLEKIKHKLFKKSIHKINSRIVPKINSKLLWIKLKKNIHRNEGFVGKPGQIIGDLSDKERVSFGYQNHIEQDLNLCFSGSKGGKLLTGDYLFVGFGTYFGIHDDITIGNNVLIAAQTYIMTCTHNYEDHNTLIQQQGFRSAPVRIGNDVWIGCKVVILPGVSIGDGSIVGAGSVVTHNIPSFEVWGGVPARKIKNR